MIFDIVDWMLMTAVLILTIKIYLMERKRKKKD